MLKNIAEELANEFSIQLPKDCRRHFEKNDPRISLSLSFQKKFLNFQIYYQTKHFLIFKKDVALKHLLQLDLGNFQMNFPKF